MRRQIGNLVVLALLASVSTTQAAPVLTATGTVQFSNALLEGESSSESTTTRAVHLSGDDVEATFDVSWTLSASQVVLNWSHVRVKSFGQSPTDPNRPLVVLAPQPSSAERKVTDANIRSETVHDDAAILVLPFADSMLAFNTSSSSVLDLRPSGFENWTVGFYTNHTRSTNLPPSHTKQISQTYAVESGSPIARGREEMTGTVRGDFIVYIWGVEVLVSESNGSTSYWSGARLSNATGPGAQGVARDEEWQFLRLSVQDGVLHFHQRAGKSQWTFQEASIQSTGTAILEDAHGVFSSPTDRYEAAGERVEIVGSVVQHTQAGDEETRLMSTLKAENAVFSVAAKSVTPDGRQVLAAWVGMLLGAALAGFMCVLGRRWWLARKTDEELVTNAERALVGHRAAKARRLAAVLVRRNRDDGEAWFLYGAALLAQRRARKLIREMERLPNAVKEYPPVAFLISRAHESIKDMLRAAYWMERAIVDPHIREEARHSPAFLELAKNPKWKMRLRAEINPAYS